MGNGTKDDKNMFEVGKRLRECREWRGLSRDELVERVEALPDNKGKTRSVKQISYIENGTRQLSSEYALLLSQALNVRIEYLLLKDGYRTEIERIGAHVTNRNEKRELVAELMKLHFYEIKNVATGRVDENGTEYQEVKFALISPRGSIRYFSHSELLSLIEKIDDYIEMQCAFQFRRLRDGVKNIYDWEV